MAVIRYGSIVNIITLIVFSPYLCISILLIVRQGLGRSWPWVWITMLSLCRLIQGALDLASTSIYDPRTVSNSPAQSGVAILTSMGLTPLFMSTCSLLNSTSRPKGRRMQWILLTVHIPLLLSFALIVAGGIDPNSRRTYTFAATGPTKVGICLYLACFLVLIWATTVISARLYLADSAEVKILTTVVLSLPFFLVDVVYMMCFAFESDNTDRFNVISGSVTIQLCMQVTMEYIIVGLYLGLGLELPRKAAKLREQVEEMREQARDMDAEQIERTILWKLHECLSQAVAATIMPALRFSHWFLGRLLRS